MLKSRLFVQVSLLMITGLTLFSVLVALFWDRVIDARFNDVVDDLTTDVSVLLLPDATAPDARQQEAINRIASEMSIGLAIYSSDGRLLGASAKPVALPQAPLTPGQWEELIDGSHWIARLPDGRIVIADLTHLGLGNDGSAVMVIFALLVIFVSALMYPAIRRVTRRLERLQSEVEVIGDGKLSMRVTVDGKDEIAKLAASFNRSTATIEDLLNRQRMLLANASHELRTPLARIRMGIELLGARDTAKREADLRMDIGELNALIDDLITLTRLDIGATENCFVPVDLRTVATEEARRIKGCSVIGDSAVILGDMRMLRHMVRNLLDNAQKYGQPPIEIHIQDQGDRVDLTVSDRGSGIPAAEHEKVFEPFFRGAGRQNVAGSGLGLPLVARISKAHDATVRIENMPNSAISIRFPAKPSGLRSSRHRN